jgi:hypothetical protein
MAKKSKASGKSSSAGMTSGSDIQTMTFNKGLYKDYDEVYFPEGAWFHARNAVNNTNEGELGTLSNEKSNLNCANAPYTIIGAVYMYGTTWAIFSTNNTQSEIGLFDTAKCGNNDAYTKVVNDKCLQFNTDFLITGAAKENFDCTWQLYFADNTNPDRTINVDRVPYLQDCTTDASGCITCVDKTQLDCNAILLNKITHSPCIDISVGTTGGTLANGSYFAVIAYTVNGVKATDYFPPSNVAGVFNHSNLQGSLDLELSNLDTDNYEEFELIIVKMVAGNTAAQRVGVYSTRISHIGIDNLEESLPTIAVKLIPFRGVDYDKSESMVSIGDNLFRIGPTSKFDFNYQPFANQIQATWKMVEYPVDYYEKGGTNVGYMRDEQYAFWIRWVYQDGSVSSSYHIPGRVKEFNREWDGINDYVTTNADAYEPLEAVDPYTPKRWQVYNTAYYNNLTLETLPDGGVVTASGKMGYWESSERYVDDMPMVWNATYNPGWSGTTNTDYDLCGKPIRHHKMPADLIYLFNGSQVGSIVDFLTHTRTDADGNAIRIRLLGVEFSNIKTPVDNAGNIIPGVVGYEILRSSRVGNKTVIAKGLLNNMRTYKLNNLAGGNTDGSQIGLFQNYPYNPLYADPAITIDETGGGAADSETLYSGTVNDPAQDTVNPANIGFYRQDIFTFHSPETNFRNPYLAPIELKLYAEASKPGPNGNVAEGFWTPVPGHPKGKLLTDLAFIVGALTGIAEALVLKLAGKKKTSFESLGALTAAAAAANAGLGTSAYIPLNVAGSSLANIAALIAGTNGLDAPINYALANFAAESALVTGYNGGRYKKEVEGTDLSALPKILRIASGIVLTGQYFSQGMGVALDIIKSLVKYRQYAWRYLAHANLHNYWKGEAVWGNTRRRIDKSLYLDPTYQNFFVPNSTTQFKINNMYRHRTVALHIGYGNGTASTIENPKVPDNTAQTIGSWYGDALLDTTGDDAWDHDKDPLKSIYTVPSCYYAGLKVRMDNQYSQVQSVRQIPIPCRKIVNDNKAITTKGIYGSSTLFGGDTYVGRYTEKNTFFYFYDWMYNVPDGTEFNYRDYYMIGYPRYWADFTEFEPQGFIASVFQHLTNTDLWELPSNLAHLDRGAGGNAFEGIADIQGGTIPEEEQDPADINTTVTYTWEAQQNPNFNIYQPIMCTYIADTGNGVPQFQGPNCPTIIVITGSSTDTDVSVDFSSYENADSQSFGTGFNAAKFRFALKNAYFYLFNSSIRDFYVESEINLAYRDWDNEPARRHYDAYSYTDLNEMFDTQIIKVGNYYKYDYSLSNTTLFSNFISWGKMQETYYDPYVSASCYVNLPNRIIYSLPSSTSPKDTWDVYLTNDYQDYNTKPITIKSINKTGFAVLFTDGSPLMYAGQDTLNTDLNTKIVLGDGGLFATPPQSVTNTEIANQYGACQNKFSAANTPFGLFWMSQSQGKIFNIGQGLDEVSNNGLKWWFSWYLPYRLTQDFPDFELIDNPVTGIGCQTVFDNDDQILYFSKKDYNLRLDAPTGLVYAYSNIFHPVINGKATKVNIYLGDPLYFENASWTVSYDPKQKYWVSFHDWHPDLSMTAPIDFYTTKGAGIWRHNYRSDDYCNFYGQYFPFEIDYIAQTGQLVNTTRNIEYIMEAYKFASNGMDSYHVLDENFDHAIIYNSEQVSGMLNLFLKPKENPFAMLTYPIINANSIDILFSKEEQKYRFNQFWDITRDRGEYTTGGVLVQQPIFSTQENGYIRDLNVNNLDYNKMPMQRKKFRHYYNHVVLIKNESRDKLMTLKIANNKLLNSPR